MRLRSLVIAVIVSAASAAYGQQQPDFSKIIGDWTGESICVGGKSPSCNDEQVVYHFTQSKNDPAKLMLAADKIVNGKPEPMGEQELAYDAARQTLTGEFQNPRYHLLWEFTIKGDRMWGVLYLLPERAVGRNIRVTKLENKQG